MHALTVAFLAGVSAETLIRWWLATRQIAAVAAHRDQVPEPFRGSVDIASQRKAADYTIARVRFGRWAVGFEAVLKWAFTLGGGLALVDAVLKKISIPEPWHGALVVLCVLLVLQLLGQPFALWRTFVLEARFGFNRVSPRLYAVDFAKRLLLGLSLYGPLLLMLLVLCERAGSTWWIWAAILSSVVAVGIAWAAPRFIAPLFNHFSPLTDTNLQQRVQGLLDRCGFAARGVFVMDGSRRSAHGNAYFTGIGRNKVVVLFDTLLARIDGDEIEAVLAHELGHFRLHHVGQRLWLSVLGIVMSFAVLGWVLHEPWVYQALGVPTPAAPMAFLLFMIVTPVLSFFVTPLRSWWWRRQEWEADDYATRHASPAKLASALIKLYRDNASTLTPDPVYSGFYDSHPPALARIARLTARV
jgi:STE24 endopeptidase